MDESPTCGKGLAERSLIPAKLGELIAAVADTLELHMKALDLTDENSRKELDAYAKLAREHHTTATQLTLTAGEMAGYRTLPMGRHDMEAMTDPKAFATFERLVQIERELMAILHARLEEDEAMLGGMRAG